MRPEGDQRDDVLDAARKVLRTDDPEAKLHELIDKGLKESDEPGDHLREGHRAVARAEGRRVGRRRRPRQARLRRARRGEGHREGAGGDRQGRQGPRAADQGALLRRASTTRSTRTAWRPASSATSSRSAPSRSSSARSRPNDGDSLADDKSYKSTIDELDDDRIGSFYVDLKPFIEQALKSDPQAARPARADPRDLPHRQARADGRRAARQRRPDRVRHDHERPGRQARCGAFGPLPRHRRDAAGGRAAR